MTNFEGYNPESKEKSKKLRLVAETLKRFVLAGTLVLGFEDGLQKTEFKDYSWAEVMETVSNEDREFLLEAAKDRIKKPVSIESEIPAKGGEEVKVSEIIKYLATLPKKWTKGEIARIKATTNREDLMTSYSGALATFNNDTKNVLFDFNIARKQERGYNVYALSHEIAHGNDFMTDADITWKERYRLYKEIKERLKSENRFKTNYLVELEEKFDEGDFKFIPLAREYWAEICAQYMSDPTQLHIDDFKLVHEFVLKNEPDYKWRERLGERAKIQGEFSNSNIPKS